MSSNARAAQHARQSRLCDAPRLRAHSQTVPPQHPCRSDTRQAHTQASEKHQRGTCKHSARVRAAPHAPPARCAAAARILTVCSAAAPTPQRHTASTQTSKREASARHMQITNKQARQKTRVRQILRVLQNKRINHPLRKNWAHSLCHF